MTAKCLSGSSALRNLKLLFADSVDAVGIQHVRQCHDAFQLVNIRPVDDR